MKSPILLIWLRFAGGWGRPEIWQNMHVMPCETNTWCHITFNSCHMIFKGFWTAIQLHYIFQCSLIIPNNRNCFLLSRILTGLNKGKLYIIRKDIPWSTIAYLLCYGHMCYASLTCGRLRTASPHSTWPCGHCLSCGGFWDM